MKIVVPYTDLHSVTEKALRMTGRKFRKVDVSKDDEAYWRLLSKLWAEGEDFCIVEQDIVVNPGVFDEFEDCPNEWAANSYPFCHKIAEGLGCTRFSGSLTRRFPEILDEVAKLPVPGFPGYKYWITLDSSIRDLLFERRVPRCVHSEVGHVGLHGCDCHGPDWRRWLSRASVADAAGSTTRI